MFLNVWERFQPVGFLCFTSEKTSLHCPFVLTHYCCDLPEAKNILGLKYGSMRRYGCHRCYAENREMSETVKAPPWNTSDMRECRNKSIPIPTSSVIQGRRKKALECLGINSLSRCSSFLEEFQFSNVQPLPDVHNADSFELLHIYLGVSSSSRRWHPSLWWMICCWRNFVTPEKNVTPF